MKCILLFQTTSHILNKNKMIGKVFLQKDDVRNLQYERNTNEIRIKILR